MEGNCNLSPKKIISYIHVKKLVERVCLAFLAHLSNTSVEVPSIGSVTVLCDFKEVFPADLHGMPPNQDIDDAIDL